MNSVDPRIASPNHVGYTHDLRAPTNRNHMHLGLPAWQVMISVYD